ncbi:MAG: hypothetical protein FWD46_02895 [Cystobacterineae bacterium]|nr:hypothetical protein [Cystobacterineae bacterium]
MQGERDAEPEAIFGFWQSVSFQNGIEHEDSFQACDAFFNNKTSTARI